MEGEVACQKSRENVRDGQRIGYDMQRSSYWRQSVGKKVLTNFTKFTEKPLCQSLFFLFFVFSCEFCEISENTFFTEHLQSTATAYKKQIQKQPPKVLYENAVLRNFAIFTGKHLCWSLFLINFIKKRLQHRYFPENIVELLRTPIMKSICERLLLQIQKQPPEVFYKKCFS